MPTQKNMQHTACTSKYMAYWGPMNPCCEGARKEGWGWIPKSILRNSHFKKTVWGLRTEKYFIAKKKKRWNSGKWTGVGKKNRKPYLHVCFCRILPPTYPPKKLTTGRKHFIHFSLPTAQYRGGLNKSLLYKQRKAETHGLPILQVQLTSKAHQLIPVPLPPTPDPTFTPSSLMVFLAYSIQPLLVNSFMHSHLLLRTASGKRIPFTLPIRLNSRLCSHYLAASAPGFFFKDLN